MFLEELSIQNLRSLELLTVSPSKRINVLLGKNNAGKTTILESIYIGSRLKTFKQTPTADLIKHGKPGLKVQLNVSKIGENHLICVEKPLKQHSTAKNNSKIIGAKEVALLFPVQALTFGTENIINQPSEQRRNILDWGLFHVKPKYLSTLQRYQRCLKHRNFLLKKGKDEELTYWTEQLVENGKTIDELRKEYFGLLQESFKEFIEVAGKSSYKPHADVFNTRIEYYQGWEKDKDLFLCLEKNMQKDRALGFTEYGPHKADILIKKDSSQLKKIGSMSSQVIISLILMLGQAEVFHVKQGDRPILLIDDLFFGIDDTNLMLVIELLIQAKTQCFLTAPDTYKDKLKGAKNKTGEIELFALENQKLTKIEENEQGKI